MEGIRIDQTDSDLVASCLEGDAIAWRTLVERYKKAVYSVPVKWGLAQDGAVHVFQSVWHECCDNLESLGGMESLRPWFIRKALHECARWSEPEIELTANPEKVLRILREVDKEETYRAAIRSLSPLCQSLIHRLVFETCSAQVTPDFEFCLEALRRNLEDHSVNTRAGSTFSIL